MILIKLNTKFIWRRTRTAEDAHGRRLISNLAARSLRVQNVQAAVVVGVANSERINLTFKCVIKCALAGSRRLTARYVRTLTQPLSGRCTACEYNTSLRWRNDGGGGGTERT